MYPRSCFFWGCIALKEQSPVLSSQVADLTEPKAAKPCPLLDTASTGCQSSGKRPLPRQRPGLGRGPQHPIVRHLPGPAAANSTPVASHLPPALWQRGSSESPAAAHRSRLSPATAPPPSEVREGRRSHRGGAGVCGPRAARQRRRPFFRVYTPLPSNSVRAPSAPRGAATPAPAVRPLAAAELHPAPPPSGRQRRRPPLARGGRHAPCARGPRGNAPLPLRSARGGGGAAPPHGFHPPPHYRHPAPPPRTRGPRPPPASASSRPAAASAEFKRARRGGGPDSGWGGNAQLGSARGWAGPRPCVRCAVAALGRPAQTAWRRRETGRSGPGEAGGQQSRTLPGSRPGRANPAKLLRPPRHNFRRGGSGSGAARAGGRCRAPPPPAARRAGRYQGDHFLIALHCFPARRRSAACAAAAPHAPRSWAAAGPVAPPARCCRAVQLTGPDEEVELVRGPLMQGRRHVYAAGAASH